MNSPHPDHPASGSDPADGELRPRPNSDPSHPVPKPPVAADADSGLAEAKTVIRSMSGSSGLNSLHASSPAEVAGVLNGQELNHFRLEQLIGGGGMGAVFRAQDTRLNRTVAIKVIPRVGEDVDLLRRFRNEAQSAARLDHRNIAQVYDVGQYNSWHYIVFEYIEGTNLRDLVARDGVLAIDDAVFFTQQVAEALEHANQRGVVHRDIKPSNVLIRPDGQVKLVDMGLARSLQLEVSEDMTASGVTLGTFDYISPEQAKDPRDADVRSDIYSLGCTLFFVLTGRPPFPGGTVLQKLLSHGNSPPPDPRAFRPEISLGLMAILHKMLAKRPADRYNAPMDLVADLHELAIRENLPRSQSVGVVTIPTDGGWPLLIRRHSPWVAASLLLVLSVAWLQLQSAVGRYDVQLPSAENASIPGPEDLPIKSNRAVLQTETPLNLAPQLPVPNAVVLENSLLDLAEPQAVPETRTPVDADTMERTITLIQVGGMLPPDSSSTLRTDSLQKAIDLATEHNVPQISIMESSITTGPLIIEQEGHLTIRGLAAGTEIKLNPVRVPSDQPTTMVFIGSNHVRFENLRFTWNQGGETNSEGGAIFRVSANPSLELVDCVLTVDNPNLNRQVYGFEIQADRLFRTDGGLSNNGPPLVAISLTNVVARGEMTLVNMDAAAKLQMLWKNGLLAVSGRLLQFRGAATAPTAGRIPLTLVMNHVTASTEKGLVLLDLQDTPVPVVIDRKCRNCAFTAASGSAHVEVQGINDIDTIDRYVKFLGSGNHYDITPGRSQWLLRATDVQEITSQFQLEDLEEDTEIKWMEERSPQAIIPWVKPISKRLRASRRIPKDFLQKGKGISGFKRQELPRLKREVTPAGGGRV